MAPLRFLAAMIARNMRIAAGAAWLLAGCLAIAAAAPKDSAPWQRLRNHFDSDAVLGAPGYFDFLVLGQAGPAQWRVTVGTNPPSTPNVATQTYTDRPEGSIAAAVRRNAVFRDGKVTVALEKGSGRGGLVFRLAGEKSFCALLVDQESGEARLTAWRDGRSTEIGRGKADLANAWGILAVTLDGPKIDAEWDGKKLLQGTDPRPVSGGAGMATEGAGSVAFDELVLEWAGKK